MHVNILILCNILPHADATQVDDALAKGLDPEIEAKRAASAQMAWGAAPGAAAAVGGAAVAQVGSSGAVAEAAPAGPAPAQAQAPAAAPLKVGRL